MQLTDVVTDLEQALVAAFGPRINVRSGNFALLIGILAERHALLWQLAEAVYSSQYPSGATGLAVDNILALAGLTRLSAQPSTTAPSPTTQANGIPLYGLVVYGTAGTVVPAGSLINDGTAAAVSFATDAAITIGTAQNGQQIVSFNSQPTGGTYALQLASGSGASVVTAAIPYNAAVHDVEVTLAGDSDTNLVFDGTTSGQAFSPGDGLSGLQAAFASSAYPTATVSAKAGTTGTYVVSFKGPIPALTLSPPSSGSVAPTVQGRINQAVDATTGLRPYSDVSVVGYGSNGGYQLLFGALTPAQNQPASGALAQARAQVVQNQLTGSNVNPTVTVQVAGLPAQGVGSATATQTGPVAEAAGSLTTIVTPISGWTGVTNQLDVVVGRNLESDAEAIGRFQSARQSLGSASTGAIATKLSALSGVTYAQAFANATDAAQQLVTFSTVPTGGNWQLVVNGNATAALGYQAAATDVQAAIQAIGGYQPTQVSGSVRYGFIVDFAGADGGQAQPLLAVTNNTTGVTITVGYGRPAHSVEAVVQGGSDADVAQALFDSAPAGIATYGSPQAQTTGSIAAGSTQLSVQSATGILVGQAVVMQGVTRGALVLGLSQTTVTLDTPAFATASGAPCAFVSQVGITDAAGNRQLVQFSRPTVELVYVSVTLVTDTFVTPGVQSSGLNSASKWSAANVPGIQQAICDAINATAVGGLIVARGTAGVVETIGQFPGIVDASIAFDLTPEPTNKNNLKLPPAGVALAEPANVLVSWV